MLTKELRNQIFETATPVQQYLYADGKSGALLNNIATRHDLTTEETYKTFAITVGDIILGFYNIADTEPLLIQELGISPDVAKPLAAEVREFLAPLDDPNWQPPIEEPEPVLDQTTFEESESNQPAPTRPTDPAVQAADTATPSVPAASNPATSELQQSIADLEKQFSQTPSLRTMAQDMQSVRSPQRHSFDPLPDDGVPTYISEQSAPTQTADNEPRNGEAGENADTRWE